MKLILLFQRNTWFVEHELAWYRIEDEAAIDRALATLALSVVDEYTQIEQPHMAGSAHLAASAKDAIVLQLREPGGKMILNTSIKYDQERLMSVEWLTRPFRDGWIDATSRIQLAGVQSLDLHLYLPASSGAETKLLSIIDESNGAREEVVLKRRATTVVPLLKSGGRGRFNFTMQCKPEQLDGSTDPRQLGFVLVNETARAA